MKSAAEKLRVGLVSAKPKAVPEKVKQKEPEAESEAAAEDPNAYDT